MIVPLAGAVPKTHELQVEGAEFTILDKKTVQLTDARAEAFYEAQASAPHFKSLVRHMTSAPVCILVTWSACLRVGLHIT